MDDVMILSTIFVVFGSGIMIWILAKLLGLLAKVCTFITSCTELNRAKAEYYKEKK